VKWLALGLSLAGIAVLAILAATSVSSPLLTVAIAGAFFVLLLPLAAYFLFSRGPTENRQSPEA
jgi:FtsH-binding integral membrane protein